MNWFLLITESNPILTRLDAALLAATFAFSLGLVTTTNLDMSQSRFFGAKTVRFFRGRPARSWMKCYSYTSIFILQVADMDGVDSDSG